MSESGADPESPRIEPEKPRADPESPRIEPDRERPPTGPEYIKWVEYQFNAGLDFAPISEAFPEVSRQARIYDSASATIYRGQATVFALKLADSLTYTQVAWHLNQLLELIPRPSALDAIGYYGALVLVFEKGLDHVKRDRLVKLAKRRMFRSGFVQVLLVDLEARATWTLDIPKSIQLLLWPLEDGLSRYGDPPPLKKLPHRLGHSGWKAPINYMTMALVAALALVHVLVFLSSPGDSLSLRLYRSGARHTWAILDGEFWRLLTQNFLHADWGHLVGNLAGLFEFGRMAEPLFGGGWLLAFFVLTGLSGSIFSWIIAPGAMSVGASGCLYGLFGVAASVFFFRRERLAFRFQGHFVRLLRVFIILNVFNLILAAFFGSNIDHLAHFGGFMAGGVLGFILPLQERAGGQTFGRWMGGIMVAASLVAGGAIIEHRDPALERYFPAEHEDLGISFDRPMAFRMKPLPDRPGFSMTNGIYARAMMCNLQESCVWMLETGAESLKSDFAARLDGAELLDVSEITLSGFRAINVRYIETIGPAEWMVEDIYIPRRGGTLYMKLTSLKRDASYYLPIFSRLKASFESRVPPPVNAPP